MAHREKQLVGISAGFKSENPKLPDMILKCQKNLTGTAVQMTVDELHIHYQLFKTLNSCRRKHT